jgi:hypothetical protein
MPKTNKFQSIDWLFLLSDIVLVLIAFLYLGLIFFDIFWPLPFLTTDIIIKILTTGFSFLIIGVVLERRRRIDRIQKSLDDILSNFVFGAQYLENRDLVYGELEQLVRSSNESIMALGVRAEAESYFNEIYNAISTRGVIYHRILDGMDINCNLHKHLLELIKLDENVQIVWIPKEKYGNITITEHGCIIAFPAPYKYKLSGLKLPGEKISRMYTQYFMEIYKECIPIQTERSLETLCEDCRSEEITSLSDVKRVIIGELRSQLSTDQYDITDL